MAASSSRRHALASPTICEMGCSVLSNGQVNVLNQLNARNVTSVTGTFDAFHIGVPSLVVNIEDPIVPALVVHAGGPAAVLQSGGNPTFPALSLANLGTPGSDTPEIVATNKQNKTVFTVDSLGNLTAAGTKSAVVSLKSGKEVKMFAMESPQNWFEDFGSASLLGGIATVTLDTKFAQTIDANNYHVFVTPNGDCRGLYVTQKTPSSFEVRELSGGQSNVSFDYRIVALRKGYEKVRMPVANLSRGTVGPIRDNPN
jgi:hypothetical protein